MINDSPNQKDLVRSPFLGGNGGKTPSGGISTPSSPPLGADAGPGSTEGTKGTLPPVPKVNKAKCSHEEALAVLKALIARAKMKQDAWEKANRHLIPSPEDQDRTEEPGEHPGETYLINASGYRWAKVYVDEVTGLDTVKLLDWKPDHLKVEEQERMKKQYRKWSKKKAG